jgi:hypothetical protein
MEIDDRLLSLAVEFEKLERRKQEILTELRSGAFDDKQRMWVLGLLGEKDQLKFIIDQHFTARRNILAEIRDLLASKPTHEFTATEIKKHLGVERSNEKSFYSALAKLHKLGQIRRVGRALYKTTAQNTKARRNSSAPE